MHTSGQEYSVTRLDLYEWQLVFFCDCNHAVKIDNSSPKVCEHYQSSFLRNVLALYDDDDPITDHPYRAASQSINLRDAAL